MNMTNEIIGREEEIKLLEECYQSGKAELVAVYAVKTNAALHLTMIASDGLATNEYSSEVQSVVTLDDLFKN